MTSEHAQLAVLLRQTQWELDSAAHDIPGDRYTAEQCTALADALDRVAQLIRAHATHSIVIDSSEATALSAPNRSSEHSPVEE